VSTKTLQIRDVPEDIHATIRARAALAGKTVSQYLLEIVTGIAKQPTLKEVADRVKARTASATGPTGEDILSALHEGRERR
jgi:plasmid stability protein